MQEIIITDDMFLKAREASVKLGVLRNSIRSGEGNLFGFLGEYITQAAIGATLNNTLDWDLKLNDLKIDVKTKATTVVPQTTYDCSVAKFNTTQKCNIYVFTRILKTFEKGQVLGWLPTTEYYEKARYLEKGQIDPSNNFTVKADCYNVAIADLNDISLLTVNG